MSEVIEAEVVESMPSLSECVLDELQANGDDITDVSEETPKKERYKSHPQARRRPRAHKGQLPRAQVNVPRAFHNLGHAPIGSIAWHMKPYRRYFENMRGQDIAMQVIRTCGAQNPVLVRIHEEWWLQPKHVREMVLALDYIVEAFNMPVDEFVALVVARIHNLLIERMKGMQLADLPDVLAASISRAKSKKPSAAAMKEAQMHLQQHGYVPAAPNASSVAVQINAPSVQEFRLPDAAEFSKRLDEAARAGRALPPANMEDFIDVETKKEQVA